MESKENENKNTINIKSEKENEIKQNNMFYNQEVKKYLKNNVENQEYSDLIAKSPMELFSSIDAIKLTMLEANLYRYSSPSGKGICDDIMAVKLDREEQNVIKNDCKRTRVRESILVPDFKNTLEKILTYYCTSKNILYKQGLNEIFGPLLLLKYKFPSLKLSKIFDIGEVFIDKFLPNFYYEKEVFSLKSSLGLFIILLRYHEPSVYNRLDSLEILPEMYATNWIMTLLSAKIKLDVIYDYWEEIIKTGDPLILHFILVSIIKLNREMIINCDTNLLPGLMASLTIQKKEELKPIMEMALELRTQTPYSFRILANKIGFLKTNFKDIKKQYEKYRPQSIPAMPIFPLEILSLTFKSGVECIDPECPNSRKKIAVSSLDNTEYCIIEHEEKYTPILNFQNILLNNHFCEKCDMKIEKKIKYILLDLRILQYGGNEKDDDFDKTGSLPNMINVDQDELKSQDFSRVITDRFVPERGLYHFIFLTSSTDTFSEFESNFYMENTTEEDRIKMMCGILQQKKADKELNLEDASKNLTSKEIYKLKEYDNLRKIMIAMKRYNFPYVSYLAGGFEALHRESLKYNIELVNHNRKECKLCKKIIKETKEEKEYKKLNTEDKISNISNTLWKNIKVITPKELNIFFSNEKNIVLVCNLIIESFL